MLAKNMFISQGALVASFVMAAFVAILMASSAAAKACCITGEHCYWNDSCQHDQCHCEPTSDFGLLVKKDDDHLVTPAQHGGSLFERAIKKSSGSAYAAYMVKKTDDGVDASEKRADEVIVAKK